MAHLHPNWKKQIVPCVSASDQLPDAYSCRSCRGKARLPTHTSQDLRHPPRHVWLVRDVFHGGEIIILWGESQAGKTALLLDMVAAIASGSDRAGHPVTRTNVDLCSPEGQIGVRTRVQALELRPRQPPEGIHYVFNPCNVASEAMSTNWH